jgi:hypothetical protein
MIAVYMSSNQFRVEEDRTGEFKTGRRIKANCDVDGYIYSTILSSSYSFPYTIVTIVENVLTSNLIDVLYGIVNIGGTGAFPDHLHDGTEGQGGALPYVTTTDFNTYSGVIQTQITTYSDTLQTQINNKPDTFLELIDTPSSYDSGNYARSTSSGIVWATAGSSNVQTFLDLMDTPIIYSNGKFAQSTTSGIVWTTVSSGTSNVQSFLDLVDAPHTYSGTTGKFAQSTGSGVVWTTVSAGSSNVQTFLDLTDTPNEYSIGKFAQSTASGIVWTTASGSGTQTFIELIDTPSSYDGQEGKFIKVVGNTLEFATVSGLGGTYDSSWLFELDENGGLMPSTGSGILNIQSFLDLTDVPHTYSGTMGKFAQSTGSGIVWSAPQYEPPTSGVWNYEKATLSGTGDIYCNDIYTASGTVYIGNLKLSSNGTNLLIGNEIASTTASGSGSSTPPTSGIWDYRNSTLSGTGDIYCGDLYMNNLKISAEDNTITIKEVPLYSGIDNFTVLMLHLDGTNGSTTFLDSSLTPKTVTRGGNTVISSIQSVFGNSSAYFDGTGDYLSVADSASWHFDNENFTVDFWVRFTELRSQSRFYQQYTSSTNAHSFRLYNDGTYYYLAWYTYNTTATYLTSRWDDVAINTWYHIAVVREGPTITKLYVNGIQLGNTFTNNYTVPNSSSTFYIGGVGGGTDADSLKGYLSEYRISKGTARWTSNFNPPNIPYRVYDLFSKELAYTDHMHSFANLIDTPNTYSDGLYAKSTTSGIVWATVSGGGTGTSYGELELTYASNIVLDFTEYNLQSVILTGNTNFTFTNMINGKPCVLNVIQDAQGNRSATFQSDIRWPQGVIPTTSSGSGLYDIFTFIQSRGTICGSCSAAFQLGS